MLDTPTNEAMEPEGTDPKKDNNPFAVNKQEMGARIRALRAAKKMTQAELARLVDMSRPAIAQWEDGKSRPKPQEVNSLAFYLNTTPQYIMFGITGNATDSYRVPVMDYTLPKGVPTGEMAIDMEFLRGLHLGPSAALRAYRLPRGDMMEGYGKGSVVIIDEADKSLVGTGEAVLIHHKVPAVAYVNLVPGRDNSYAVNIGGQRFQVDGGLPVIGRIVAVLKSFV